MTVPHDAAYVEFEFRWGNPGDGDFLTLHFGDDLLFNYLGTVFGDDGFVESGPIPFSQYAGQTGQLLFSLNSVGNPNAEVAIRNLRFYEVSGTTMTPTKDAFIHLGAPNLNEGANPKLVAQVPPRQRAVVGFDENAITDFVNEHGLSKATLALTIADVGGIGAAGDRSVSAHPLLVDFAEGNGKSWGLPPRSSVRGDGPGVTWNCAVDEDIGNPLHNCVERWDGGDFGPATAPPVIHANGMTGEVEWDVTDDVLDGASAWLIKKSDELPVGRARYHSEEGAIEAGNVGLAPRLILEK